MKTKLTLLISVLILTHSISYSQWIKTNGPYGQTIYSLAVSGSNIFAGTDGHVYKSTNDGLIWTQTSLNEYVNSLVISRSNLFAGATLGVFISTNNGQNWTPTPLGQWTNALAENDSMILAGTNFHGVYKSTDNGQTWTQTSLNSQTVASLSISGTNIFAGIVYGYGYGNGGVYFSSNYGQSWTLRGLTYHTVMSLAISGSNIFAGTYENSGLYLSTNTGLTWIHTTLDSENVWSLAIIGSNIFAGTAPSGIYLSTNNGLTWILRNEGMGNQSILSITYSTNYIFVGTNENAVWKRLRSDFIGISNISGSIPQSYFLYQNYPNPFNSSTEIKFDISSNVKSETSIVKLTIFDILGKEVATLVNESLKPGSYQLSFDAASLATGLYFYNLQSGDFVETKKMILLK